MYNLLYHSTVYLPDSWFPSSLQGRLPSASSSTDACLLYHLLSLGRGPCPFHLILGLLLSLVPSISIFITIFTGFASSVLTCPIVYTISSESITLLCGHYIKLKFIMSAYSRHKVGDYIFKQMNVYEIFSQKTLHM